MAQADRARSSAGKQDTPAISIELERELFIRSFSFAQPSGDAARQIAAATKEVFFSAGEELFSAGDEPTELFFLARGVVDLEAEDGSSTEFVPPAVLGILDLNLERPRLRTARARTDVVGLVVPAEDYLEIQQDNYEFTRSMIESVARNQHAEQITLGHDAYPDPPPDDAELAAGLEMNLVERIVILRETMCFADASVQCLTRIAGHLEILRLKEGDVLFATEEVANAVYIVACGRIRAERVKEAGVSGVFGRGSLVCGVGALGDVEHEYRAWATSSQAIVMRLDENDLADVMEDHFDLVLSIHKGLAGSRDAFLTRAPQRRSIMAPAPEPVAIAGTPSD